MNKCIFTIVIALNLFNKTLAQSHKENNSFDLGIKGGATFSNIFVSAPISIVDIKGSRFNNRTVIGSTYGIVARYLAEKHFALQIEANYVQKGWKEVFRDPQDDLDPNRFYQVSLDYLTVPILAHGHFGKRNVQLFLNAGLYLAYLLYYETMLSENVLENDEITFPYREIDQNTFDLGLQGGGGMEILTAVGSFQLEGGYALGLNSVIDKYVDDIPTLLQNSTTWITIGYLYSF